MKRFRGWRAAVLGLSLPMLLFPMTLYARDEASVTELKARVANTSIPDRPPLCIRIAELQMDEAGKFYAAGENEKAKAALTDVVAFAELARDYAVQSHKHEKQCEISIRKLVRKLNGLIHSVSHEDQGQVQNVIDKLERIRDDLLLAMFPKVGNK